MKSNIDTSSENTTNKKKNPYGLTGLTNPTLTTCYMNSAIQALSHNYPLTSFFFEKKHEIHGILLKNARKIFKDSEEFKLSESDNNALKLMESNAKSDDPFILTDYELILGLKQKIQDANYCTSMLNIREQEIIYNHTITAQLIKLLETMWKKNSIIIPTSFRKVFSEARNKFFFGYEQHDAEEAYSCIIQKMQEELSEEKKIKFKSSNSVHSLLQFKDNISKKIRSTNDIKEKEQFLEIYYKKKLEMPVESLRIEAYREMQKYYEKCYSRITEIFCGFLHSSIKCPHEKCGYVKNKFEPFLHLSLEIPHVANSNNYERNISIDDCINYFCQDEALDEKNLWNCEKCNNKVCAIKNLRLWTIPPVLVIQFKRFKQSNTGVVSKDERLITYPVEHFDVSPIISPTQINECGCNKYRLQCVINHKGGKEGGHYYTYCLDEDSGNWYVFNDMIVTKINNLRQIVTRTAYLLFYIREDLIVK